MKIEIGIEIDLDGPFTIDKRNEVLRTLVESVSNHPDLTRCSAAYVNYRDHETAFQARMAHKSVADG